MNGQRYPGTDFRTVPHHQDAGKRSGAWSVRGSRDCQEPRWPNHMPQHPRRRNRLSNLFSAGRSRHGEKAGRRKEGLPGGQRYSFILPIGRRRMKLDPPRSVKDPLVVRWWRLACVRFMAYKAGGGIGIYHQLRTSPKLHLSESDLFIR